jgi:hypothetical protein
MFTQCSIAAVPGYISQEHGRQFSQCQPAVTTCREIERKQHSSANSRSVESWRKLRDCIAGNYCADGMYEDDYQQCRTIDSCTCYHSGAVYQPRVTLHTACQEW